MSLLVGPQPKITNQTKIIEILDEDKLVTKNPVLPHTVMMKIENGNCNLIIESRSKQILDQQKIFEEYYREQNSEQEGFGLGLNLVKRICSEENVGIKLESGKNWASFTYTFKEIK